MNYELKDFDYNLPSELIAQKPVRPRDHSRLLVLDRKNGAIEHNRFHDLIDYLWPGDLLVLNNSKVFQARLIGKKAATGGAVEIFLHRKLSGEEVNSGEVISAGKTAKGKKRENTWECLIGGRVKEGLVIEFANRRKSGGKKSSDLQAEVLKNNHDGTWQVKFNLTGDKFWKTINKIGLVPLPPYIKRDKKNASDKSNYQTVFADKHKVGSVAAPTAGFHFTKNLLKKIKTKGVKIVYVTLHVGLGTFAPVKTGKISEHKMHSEFAEISAPTIASIVRIKKAGGRVIAVGTTSCRTLESTDWSGLIVGGSWAGKTRSADLNVRLTDGRDGVETARLKSQSFWTDIFIYPGYKFKVIDALITNFHLPKSTLLMLVSALAGKKKIDIAYKEAVTRGYRFFSYGDAMMIY